MRVAIAAAGFAFLCVSTCPADARPGEPFVASITALPAVTGSVNLTVAGGGEGDGGRIARLAAREAQQAIRAANRDARDAARDAMQAARGAARESMQAARDAARMASMQAVQQSVTQAANFSALHQVQEAARNAGMDAARDVMNKASLQAGVRHIKIDRHQDFKHDNLELSGAVNNAAHESVQNVMRESHDVNFNLGAAKDGMYANIAAPVQISTGGKLDSNGFVVGGVAQTINPGDRISAAEYAAVQQVLGGGGQSVLLGEKGSAVGGAVTLTPDSGLNISRLQLPSSVQLNLVGFTETNPFTISGGARISGDVFSLQGEQGLGSFNNLGSLHIGESGNWTGTLPSFTGPGSLYSSSSLTFNIQNSLNNLGSITSPGALSINAGGNIVNTGSNALMQGASLALNAGQSISNTGALIATAGNASLYSSIGQITNAGLINAQNGNIAFDAASNSALYVNNTGGVIQALKGAVDMRLADYKGSAYSLLQGGDVLSETVNLYSGSGMTDMFVN
ncbi:MAG: hypothetical protein IT342_10940, partial [Candidatus Melainabacteria bacterium]|nr:hypothetical protein [Candidatus Melainabacteria bacterium]